MGRIKVKIRNPNEEKKMMLLRILSCNNVYATRLIQINDGFNVITQTDQDLDKIVSKVIAKDLREADFQPITPPELKLKRSVILTRVDDYIYKHNENEIKEGVAYHNE